MATVKVAVRVRPLNKREIDMDSKIILEMEGKKTKIFNPKVLSCHQGDAARDRQKEFSYDYSYWSVDQDDPNFVTQEQVFSDLGTKVVESAFEGYNACVFAYGQTGSGKTHTMMGTEQEIGLVPRICQALFNRMHQEKEEGVTFSTQVSYLEIYNEKVKDLLKKEAKPKNLRLREHPKLGPYVEDLSKHLVMDYRDVEELMTQGNDIRTTASTKMNDTSSRSHAIFTLTFVQAKFDHDMPSETVSKIHLVDLAGSERADATGSTGKRLKEGGHINKSLVTLGSVISALADIPATGGPKVKQAFIPYRDSALTWLLKDSLGGNSKTIMIATVSPADCNYGETLSTLRYANRAKDIVNKPQVNEDPNVKLIRDLKEEIAKLKSKLDGNNQATSSPLMVERLHENEARVKVLTEEWTERWRETQKILQEQKALGLRKAGMGIVLDSDMPHLVRIDDDLFSTGITLYHLKDGQTLIGSESSEKRQDIVVNGADIEVEHCIIELQSGTATLIPIGQALCYIDGVPVEQPSKLSQGCAILLGRTMFRYNDPVEAAKLRQENKGVKVSEHCSSEQVSANIELRITILHCCENMVGLSRSRLSFLSWSMPDLAHMNDSSVISPSSRVLLANLAIEGANPMDRKNIERQLVEAKDALQEERRNLQQQWDVHFEKEKNLLKEYDSARYDFKAERIFPDKEQEILEEEKQQLELEEYRLDEKEKYLREAYQQIIGEEIDAVPNNLISEEENSNCKNGHENLVIEGSDATSKDEFLTANTAQNTTTTHNNCVSGDMPVLANYDAIPETLDEFETNLELEKLRNEQRFRKEVEQEVKRQLATEVANRLLQTESLDRNLLGSCRMRNYQHLSRSESLGYYGNRILLEPSEPSSITIPSHIMRGVGYNSHYQYQIKIVLSDKSWTILRRYKLFRELHLRMKQKYGAQVGNLYFPPRTIFGSKSDKRIKERQANLERYLQQLVEICLTLPNCPLYQHTFETLTQQALCDCMPFFQKGLFEVNKHGTY